MFPLSTLLLLIAASLINGVAVHPRPYAHDSAPLNEIAGVDSSSVINPRENPCPDFRIEAELKSYLGTDANILSKCSWKIKFTCAVLLATCPVNCILALSEGGLNPVLDASCLTCMGANGAACAECFEKDDGVRDVCRNSLFPGAHCVEPVCSQYRTLN